MTSVIVLESIATTAAALTPSETTIVRQAPSAAQLSSSFIASSSVDPDTDPDNPNYYPLTTIFKAASTCFSPKPTDLEGCTTLEGVSVRCRMQVAEHCFPSGGYTITATNNDVEQITFFPGVLPYGFKSFYEYTGGSIGQPLAESISHAAGCPDGWTWKYSPFMCNTYLAATGGQDLGTAVSIPALVAHWRGRDLATFTPASAPALPSSAINAFAATIPAATPASRSSRASSTSRSSDSSTASSTPDRSRQKQQQEISSGLSTGAKAGIGVGTAVVALLIAAAFWMVRRRRAGKSSVRRARSQRPYVDGKGELEGVPVHRRVEEQTEMPGKELYEADSHTRAPPASEPHEADSPPPIPFASKPRWELDGGYRGEEVGPQSPCTAKGPGAV
ncbi:uncharacterized protein LTR77_008778 [Saxophila tyrrhenica]|uniref:Uncharacterized protein n=1 Tax=Saxophila tyrrhenica TaxID=1690608 RepID=A0AAV9P254_9PEZI|nr:hypothetical protein LTR77_008778 [Saxophila tyrrhenica]